MQQNLLVDQYILLERIRIKDTLKQKNKYEYEASTVHSTS